MQYIRRRIQRVSGVTIRDERIESRDFPVQPWRDDWDEVGDNQNERAASAREKRAFIGHDTSWRERT